MGRGFVGVTGGYVDFVESSHGDQPQNQNPCQLYYTPDGTAVPGAQKFPNDQNLQPPGVSLYAPGGGYAVSSGTHYSSYVLPSAPDSQAGHPQSPYPQNPYPQNSYPQNLYAQATPGAPYAPQPHVAPVPFTSQPTMVTAAPRKNTGTITAVIAVAAIIFLLLIVGVSRLLGSAARRREQGARRGMRHLAHLTSLSRAC